MNNKNMLLVLCIVVTAYGPVRAQADISLPQSNITSGTEFSTSIATTNFRSLFTTPAKGQIRVAAHTGILSAGGSKTDYVPINRLFLKLISVGTVNLAASSPEVNLTTQYQDLYNAVFSQRTGPVVIRYRIPVSTYGWEAGTYQTSLLFTYTSLTGASIETNKKLTLTVPAFMTLANSPPNVQLLVNSLDYFRNDGVATSVSLGNITSTVPYNLGLKTGASSFSYDPAPGNAGVTDPNAVVTSVSPSINTSAPVTLTNTEQPLFSSDVAVPVGNVTTAELHYSISSAALMRYFKHAGVYSVPLAYRAYSSVNKLSIEAAGSVLNVQVAEMGDLQVSTPVVDLALNTAADYENGTSVEVPAHLKLSKTIPYDLYVSTSSPDLTNGSNTIPVSIIKVGAVEGETGVPTVTLSATPVSLFSGAAAVIDRSIGIKYVIDPAAAKTLVGKAPGIYTVNVIYSFVAN